MKPQAWKILQKLARKGLRKYPLASVALYGADDRTATKLVASILAYDGAEAEPMRKWFSTQDIRHEAKLLEEVLDLLTEQGVRSVVMLDRLIGCPHEEGVDYPLGQECPQCPFWHGIDRWTGDRIR